MGLPERNISAIRANINTFGLIARKNGGADTSPRPRINLIEGSNITLTVADDSVSNEIDITVASSATPSPLTTKGDIYVYSTTNDRLPIGADTFILTADSTQATGMKWAAPSGASAHNILSATHSDTLADTVVRGDFIVGNLTPKWSRFAIGTSGKFIRSDGTDPSWQLLVDADIPDILTLSKISNLTTNGFVKTSGGDGTLSIDTNTYLTGNQTITLSGDITGSGTTAINTTLATVNANVGTWGSVTQVGQFTVNGKGLITAASNVTITPAASSITDGADLTLGTSLTLTAGTLTAILLAAATIDTIQDIRITATPQFAKLGLGLAAGTNELNVAATHTDTAAGAISSGLYVITLNPASASSTDFRIFDVDTRPTGANDYNIIQSHYGIVRWLGSGNATTLVGGFFSGFTGSTSTNFGTITRSIGVDAYGVFHFTNNPTGTITTAIGIKVNASTRGGASLTVTNNVGVMIAEQTIGTNDSNLIIGQITAPSGSWSIYNSSLLNNYFNGDVLIGSTTDNARLYVAQVGATSGTPNPILRLQAAAHTTLANAEVLDVNFNLARTVQFTGNVTLATQRAVIIQAPTYSSDTATKAITEAATVCITGDPIAGTNVSFPSSKNWSLMIGDSGYTATRKMLIRGNNTGIRMDSDLTGGFISAIEFWNNSVFEAEVFITSAEYSMYTMGTQDIWFGNNSGTERLRLKSSGLSIFKSNSNTMFEALRLENDGIVASTSGVALTFYNGASTEICSIRGLNAASSSMVFHTVTVERMRLNATGLGIGATPTALFSVAEKFHIDTNGVIIKYNNATPTSGQILISNGTSYQSTSPAYYYGGASATGNDTYVATLTPAPTAYVIGQMYIFKADVANTGAASINFNSLGAKTIVKAVSTTLANNDILANMFCLLVYDGTNMVLMNPRAL